MAGATNNAGMRRSLEELAADWECLATYTRALARLGEPDNAKRAMGFGIQSTEHRRSELQSGGRTVPEQ